MTLEPRQLAILQGLVSTENEMRERGQPTDFILLQMPGPRTGLKPGIADEDTLAPVLGDILDLETEGYVHMLSSRSSTVLAAFALTAAGRAAGRRSAVQADIQEPVPSTAPPSADDVLAWMARLAKEADGSGLLAAGGALLNAALDRFGQEHLESVARHMIDLQDDGLLAFDDPLAGIDQLPESERLSRASGFRLTAFGRDRVVYAGGRTRESSITQIVLAEKAQVAAGNIENHFESYNELLDRIAEALEALTDIDEEAKQEARGILDKLRSASGTIATGASASAGGAVLGGVLKGILGLP
jgi:hypothetical protein